MTPNTDDPDNDTPDAADDDAAYHDSIILDWYLQRKIDPKSMLKLKKIKITVTDANTATVNASPNRITTSHHAPNAAAAPDTAAATA